MQIIKYLGYGALLLVVLIVVASLVLPDHFKVERSIVLKSDKSAVFEEVANYNNWGHWSPWMKKDSTVRNTITAAAATVGHTMKWTSEKSGNGSLSIVEVTPTDSVRMLLQFDDMDMHSSMQFKLEQLGDSVRLSIINTGELKFMSRIFGLLFDRMLGRDYENGLSNIKDYLAEQAAHPSLKLEEVMVPARQVMLVSEKCATTEIGPTLGKLYGEIGVQMGMQGLTMSGPPFALYDKYATDIVELRAGIAVNNPGKSVDRVEYTELPATKALRCDYYGPYSGLREANLAIMDWMKNNRYTFAGSCWEVYVSDPMTEKDSTKILTQIYYSVK